MNIVVPFESSKPPAAKPRSVRADAGHILGLCLHSIRGSESVTPTVYDEQLRARTAGFPFFHLHVPG